MSERQKYRDSLGIIRDMLLVVKGGGFGGPGARKSHIMYGANLSFSQTKKFLGKVMSAGLLCKEGSLYFISDKGEEFLQSYDTYEKERRAVDTEKESLEKMLRSEK